jgi:DNA-binding MarR family transcriptional regulator
MLLTLEQKILIELLKQEPLQNNQIARRVGITQEHCCRIVKFLAEEGLLMSEFHAPRRLSRLSTAGRRIAEYISEAEKIATNLKPSF